MTTITYKSRSSYEVLYKDINRKQLLSISHVSRGYTKYSAIITSFILSFFKLEIKLYTIQCLLIRRISLSLDRQRLDCHGITCDIFTFYSVTRECLHCEVTNFEVVKPIYSAFKSQDKIIIHFFQEFSCVLDRKLRGEKNGLKQLRFCPFTPSCFFA